QAAGHAMIHAELVEHRNLLRRSVCGLASGACRRMPAVATRIMRQPAPVAARAAAAPYWSGQFRGGASGAAAAVARAVSERHGRGQEDGMPRDGRLAGKVAIVTGAASRGEGVGNGKATAIRFAREGARVVLVNRSAERAEALAAEIMAEGGEA